ncbi:hypothetical protein AVEN_162751-1, partial [Araneus ventricosus]
RKWPLSHHEAIRCKHPGVLSDDVIFLHDNAHAVRKTQELLQKYKKEVQEPQGKSKSTPHTAHIWHLIWVPNTYLEQGSLQTVMWKQLPRTADMISTKAG